MTHRCPPETDLPAVLELRVNDPRRIECEDCPRCASLLRELQAFLRGDDTLDAAERADVDRVLGATIADAFPIARPARRRRVHFRIAAGWAFTAVAAVAAFVLLRGPGDPALDPSGVLRGKPDESAVTVIDLVTGRPERGVVSLSWAGDGHAGPYRIEVYSSSLDTLFVADGLSPSTFRLEAAALPWVPSDSTLLVRVQTTRGATVPSTSGLRSVDLR